MNEYFKYGLKEREQYEVIRIGNEENERKHKINKEDTVLLANYFRESSNAH